MLLCKTEHPYYIFFLLSDYFIQLFTEKICFQRMTVCETVAGTQVSHFHAGTAGLRPITENTRST